MWRYDNDNKVVRACLAEVDDDPISQFDASPKVSNGLHGDLHVVGTGPPSTLGQEVGLGAVQDPWAGKSLPNPSPGRSVSPTVGFAIDQEVYVPFTLEQCVQLLVVSHPAQSAHFMVAHPEFTPFWMVVGEDVALQPECWASTSQGVTVVFDQGLWPNQCAWCLRPFGECVGCVFPAFVPKIEPSRSLPRELRIAGAVFDDWKVYSEVGMTERQSFSFVLETNRGSNCWNATVGDVNILIIFTSGWCAWFEPQRGMELTVFEALLVGVWGETKVFLVEEEGRSFLVRKWKNEGLRFLELFAGIGGWGAALPFMVQNAAMVAIEIDPARAQRLANMRACPVVPIEFLSADMATQEVVLVGDVRDKRWLKISLAWPFRGVLHSPPCTSFSGGGDALGLQTEDGQLMLHSLGCLAALGPEFSIGENVKGLLKHPHWHLVHRFAEFLGLKHLRVKLLDLEQVMPMRRPRCFFCFFANPMDFSILGATQLRLPVTLSTIAERYEVGLTPEEEAMLSDWQFLAPFDKRVCSHNPGEVLARRTYKHAPLPVLMAAYKHQIKLPRSSLIDKGLYTWLVHFGGLRRYLHACEAARLLGFGPSFLFTADGDADLTVLGNSVSPIQVLQVLRPVLQNLGLVDIFPEVELRELVALVVCGWPFLRTLSIRTFGGTLRFGMADGFERPQDGQILVVCQSHTWWLSHHRLFQQGTDVQEALKQILGIGKEVCIRKCMLFDDIVEVHVEFEPVMLFGYNFSFGASPLSTWGQVLGLLEIGLGSGAFAKVHLETPLWMLPSHRTFLDYVAEVREYEVQIFSANGRRVVEWQEGQTAEYYVRQAFPFAVAAKLETVRDMRRGVWVSCYDPLEPGCYQVGFGLGQVMIQPLGHITCGALATVGQVQRYLAERFYHGKAQPLILVGGRSVSSETLVLAANTAGVLRMRIFPLKGGVFSLARTEERLQSLLKEHGVEPKEMKTRVAEVVDKLSFEVVKKCLDSKSAWAALKTEATKHNIRLVTVLEREAKAASSSSNFKKEEDPLIANDPWKRGSTIKKVQKERHQPTMRIDETFFHVQGRELPVISVDELMRGAEGLVIEPLPTVLDRLPALLQRSRTTGPAALILCGCSTSDLPKDLPHSRCLDLVVPGWVGPHSSAIRSVLFQVGDVEVKYKAAKADITVEDYVATKVVMIHVFREESDSWVELQRGLAFFLKKIGFSESRTIQQVWGLGYYSGTKRTGPDQAKYAHGFVRILEGFVVPLLRLSGTEGMYATPRTAARTVDPAYKVIAFPGFSRADAKRQLDLLDDPLGLVRTSKGFGVRVRATQYTLTKKALFPDLEESEDSEDGGPRRFRLLAVPVEYEKSTVKALLKQVGWGAKVLRGQGIGTWLVSASDAPPVRSIDVKGATIVILEDQMMRQKPIVASTSRNVLANTTWKVAPREQVDGKAPPLLPEVKSRFEQLESKTMTRVDNLEQQVSVLAAQVKENAAQTATAIDGLSDKVEQVAKIEDKFEQFLRKFGQQTEQRIQRIEEQQAATLHEIKQAIEQSPKVRKVEAPTHP